MSIGVFTDKKHQPTEAEIVEAIGPRLALWQELGRHVRATYPVEEDIHYLYGKGYGWALQFRVRNRMLVNLYPASGGFMAQVNLSPEAVEQALGIALGENVRQTIERSCPLPEGRWVFAAVESEEDVRDIEQLLVLRARAERLASRRRG